MAYSQRLLKLSNLAHALFEENMTGRNTHRSMFIPEMNSVILIVACRFLDVAKFFAYHSGAAWSKTARFNAMQIINEVLIKYDRHIAQWKEEKLKERHGYTFPRCNIATTAQKKEFKAILDNEMQLIQYIKAYTQLSKCSTDKAQTQQSGSIMMETVSLVSSLIALVDQEYAIFVQKYISMAITNSKSNALVDIANNKQRSEIVDMLKATTHFTDSVIMAMSTENFYVISFVDDPEKTICGFAITNQAVHKEAGENKEVVITYIETIQGHRRSLVATRLLMALKTTAKSNGYHCMYAVSVYPNLMFWKKCGFEPRQNGKMRQLAFCCLDQMSFYNILN